MNTPSARPESSAPPAPSAEPTYPFSTAVGLLERDVELATLGDYWAQAITGHGRLVFLGGEGGAGKTSVAMKLAGRIRSRARLLIGACDAGSTPRALGPLLDVAAELGLQAELSESAVRHNLLFPKVRAGLGRMPSLLLLEDVHWADEATLDLIRYLGRRMGGLPVLVVATYRNDEVTGIHPLAHVMGDLATAAGVRRMQLQLLSAGSVAQMARVFGGKVEVPDLYRMTNGNPFFVTEVLAAGSPAVPATVRDAILARASRLSEGARLALDAAAVIGTPAEIGLLRDVSGQASSSVNECVAGGFLLDGGTTLAFRHELAREGIYDALAPATRIDLHRRVLTRLVAARSTDHRRLALHSVACGAASAVVIHAPRAAELAARLGSHREAAEHLRIAVRHADALRPTERADLLEQLSYQCHLTSRQVEALETRLESVALHEASGDARRVGAGQRWVSRLSWFLGRTADAQRFAEAAVSTLEPLGLSAELAMAYSNLSMLRNFGDTAEEALAWGERARDAARLVGDREVEAHALNNVGTALLRRGDLIEGRARLEQSLAIALADGLDEHAIRAWINIGVLQAAKRMLPDAERTFRTGMQYCADRDLDSGWLYHRGWLAGVLLERGNPATAVQFAEDVLRHPGNSPVNRIPALLAVTFAAVRRGDPAAVSMLAELQGLARRSAEPLRLLPVALLLAEAAWTAGRASEIVSLTDDVWAACNDAWEPWILAELAWWRTKGGASDSITFELPQPFSLMRAQNAGDSSAAWTAMGRPFWAALALADGGPSDAAESVAALLRLGAPASAQAVRRDLAARGLPVPRGPRRAAMTNAAGLTARELDVLGLLVEGLSDAEVAARLTLSERTVAHHVSAVLRKLDVPSRSRAAAAAARILTPPQQT